MRYAKLIEQTLTYAPSVVQWRGRTVVNPSGDKLVELGWKPVTYTDPPEPLGNGWWMETWTETADSIVQGWAWHETTDEDEISPDEAMEILMGGEGI